jgi:hypothetical protein
VLSEINVFLFYFFIYLSLVLSTRFFVAVLPKEESRALSGLTRYPRKENLAN